MTCEDLRQDYTSFALGVADDPERTEIAEHLARNCPTCVPGVASAMTTVTAITGAVKVSEPPRDLRRRIINTLEKEPKRSWAGILAPWALTALMSIALIAIGLTGRKQSGGNLLPQQALAILDDPSAKAVSFGEGTSARGHVIVSAEKGIVFAGTGMPSIDPAKTFELWVLPAAGKPIPAGLFRSQSDATAVYVHPGPVTNAARIAVTIEPADGSAQPTTSPFAVATL